MGVEEKSIGKLIRKQLGFWFGLPVVSAIVVSTVLMLYFLQSISAEIIAYVGIGTLAAQIGMMVGILLLLLICYLISTWLLFRRSVQDGRSFL